MNPLSPTYEELESDVVTAVPAADELPGERDVIDQKYELTKLIGEGGMGVVYEAVDLRSHQPVAIKFLHPEAAQAPGAMFRFMREAQAAAQLRGPYVARVLDVNASATPAYMVMELLRGRDLEAELRVRGALPIEEAVDIVLQCCEAMKEAHARGIVHRDIKPSNIFLAMPPGDAPLTDDGSPRHPLVKVLDFGVSLIAENQNMARVTATAMSVGTPLYMSPEQVRCSKRVDTRTDIWSLGVVLFEALVGEPPFDGTSTAAVAAIVADETPSARTSRPDVPLSLDGVVARALAKDVRGRFQTVEELACALAPFGSGRIRRRTRIRLEELARTWLAWPPARKPTTSTQMSRPVRSRAFGGRLRLVAALGGCLVVLPAMTFGFAREGDSHAQAPMRCADTVQPDIAATREHAAAIATSAKNALTATMADMMLDHEPLSPKPREGARSKHGAERRAGDLPASAKPARALPSTSASSAPDDPLYL